MQTSLLSDADDIQAARELVNKLSVHSMVVDFEEQILLSTVRKTIRLWKHGQQLAGFAFVDDYNNLWFDADPTMPDLDQIYTEMIAWGVDCLCQRNLERGETNSLDACCDPRQSRRVGVLLAHGFKPQSVTTMRFSRLLSAPITPFPFPAGYALRSVNGIEEVDRLVALHRAAFGTDNMTVEQRVAMMQAPHYRRDLDLVVTTQAQELAAFCVCGLDGSQQKIGYTDPVGVHPRHQRLGLGKAVLSAGLVMLRDAGAEIAELGTSSENIAMQKLADSVGFVCESEKQWFSLEIS